MKKLISISIVLMSILLLMFSSVVAAESPSSNQIPAGYFKGAYVDYKTYTNFSFLPNGTYPDWAFPIEYENYTINSINESAYSVNFIFTDINNYNITPIKYIAKGNETISLPNISVVNLTYTSNFTINTSGLNGVMGGAIIAPTPPFLNIPSLTFLNSGYNSGKEVNNTTVYSNQQYTGPLGSFKVDIVKNLGAPPKGSNSSEYINQTWVYDSYTGILVNYTYTNYGEVSLNVSIYTEAISTNMPLSAPPNYVLISIIGLVIAAAIVVIVIDRKKIFKKR